MVSRINQSQAYLNRAGLGSRADSKAFMIQEPQGATPQYGSSQKQRRLLLEMLNNKQNTLDLSAMKTLMTSPINKKLSPKPQTAGGNSFFLASRTPKNISSYKLSNINPNNRSHQIVSNQNNSIEENIKEETPLNKQVFSKSDFTSEAFLIKLLGGFSRPGNSRPTTTLYNGRATKQISIKHAQRILQSLVDGLKFLKDYKFGELTNPKTNQRNSTDIDEPHVKLAKFDLAITESLELCHRTINERSSSAKVDQYTRKLIEEAQASSNSEFILYTLYVQGKICMARCDYKQAVTEFKHFKELCSTYNVFSRRLHAYKMLGICYQHLKMHKTALIYFTKFLYMAWHIDSPKHELLAYDFIGLQYYYLGILDKAEHFHNRMVGGKLEPKLSRLRHIGVTKIRLNKPSSHGFANGNKTYDIDGDFDIDLHWGQTIDKNFREDDEGAEVSGRDEGYEPPMANMDEDENRYGFDALKKKKSNVLIKNRATIKAIPGFVKAKVTIVRKSEEKERKRGFTLSRGQVENNLAAREKNLFRSNPRSSSSCFFNSKPNEQIFTSHLSRNRGLKNFSVLGATNSSYGLNDSVGCNDDLDSKSSEQVKKIIEKVKANLEVVRENLNSVYTRPRGKYY